MKILDQDGLDTPPYWRDPTPEELAQINRDLATAATEEDQRRRRQIAYKEEEIAMILSHLSVFFSAFTADEARRIASKLRTKLGCNGMSVLWGMSSFSTPHNEAEQDARDREGQVKSISQSPYAKEVWVARREIFIRKRRDFVMAKVNAFFLELAKTQ